MYRTFLAALGMRDESRLGDPDYCDPVSNSLFVDIGAGTTDFCIVQGYLPKTPRPIKYSICETGRFLLLKKFPKSFQKLIFLFQW